MRLSSGLAIGLLLAGCSGEATDQRSLALACQTAACVCVEERQPLFGKANTVEILWKPNGDAYCPKRFKLVREDN